MKNYICRFSATSTGDPTIYVDTKHQLYSNNKEQRLASQLMLLSGLHFTLKKHKDGDSTSRPFRYTLYKGYTIIEGSGKSISNDNIATYYFISKECFIKIPATFQEYAKAIDIRINDADMRIIKTISKIIITVLILILCLIIAALCLMLFL